MQTFEDEIVNYALHKDTLGPKFSPFFVPKMIADICAGQISIKYGFHGPNYITSSACASSTNALADAFNLIRLGKANVIVSGGAEAAIIPFPHGAFSLYGILFRSAVFREKPPFRRPPPAHSCAHSGSDKQSGWSA